MNGGESDQLRWQAFQHSVASASFRDVFPCEHEQTASSGSIVASLEAAAGKTESHVLVYFF